MTSRYFVAQPIGETEVTLDGPEAHHLLHVMRAKVGDEVVLFDNSGDEFSARITRLDRTSAVLAVVTRRKADRETPCPITLAVALPKGDRQRWLVEKAVELGVARLVPLRTERGVAQPEPKAIARLQRTVIESSKQSGRNRLMEVAGAVSWTEFAPSCRDAALRLIAQPEAELAVRDATASGLNGALALAVGPEGGFSPQEIEAALANGWKPVGLGPRILRVETAALALVAACSID